METIIKTESLTKIYNPLSLNPKLALDQVSLDVKEGEFIAIMGKSGSGKTTLLNILSTIDDLTKGKLFIYGKNIYEMSETERAHFRKENIGFIFQNFNLLSSESAQENVALPLIYVGVDKEKRNQRAIDALNKVDLGDRITFKPSQLSGGQKQRVAIAGILAIEPDIIIFDESTSMLDPQGKASINAQIRKLHEEKNITILSITHDMEEVAQSENVIVLENGEIAMQGTPMDIFRQEDKLAKMQLDIPFALKISKELKKRGIFKENVCRLDEVVEKLCRLK